LSRSCHNCQLLCASIDRSASPSIRIPSPASSELSDLPPPPKKRRISTSSLSEEDDDDDEEDKPLAALMVARPAEHGARTVSSGKRSGKKVSSMKSKAQTAPASIAPPTWREQAEMNGKVNGINGHDPKVKVEDKMDEGQLTRLATGVTIDAGGAMSAVVSFLIVLEIWP
jgi:histone acetyltransferase